MSKNTDRFPRLGALSTAALALPAIAQLAHADAPSQKTEIGYRYSQYEETSLDADQVLSGSNERYTVDNQQFRLVTPVAKDLTLTVDAAYETMSGASAYGTALDGQGNHRLVMSGASIRDTRKDVLAGVRKSSNDGAMTISAGFSQENDYTAYNAALEGERYSHDRNTTWSGGVGVSSDDIEPEQTPGIARIEHEERQSIDGYAALTRVLSPVWQIQAGVFGAFHDGYLSDPYKARDIRPDERQSMGVSLNSRYFVRGLRAALHGDYRLYQDDWGIEAHTVTLSWHQTLNDHLQVTPQLRYYSQSQADFYVDADSAERSGEQSSDYRLSPFGALGYGVTLSWDEPRYRLLVSAEQYESDGGLALKNVNVESPALVDYTLLTVGLDYRF